MRALILGLVVACAHREASPPAPPPPPPPPPPVDAAVTVPPDAPPIPTATGGWDKQEIEAERTPPAPDQTPSAVLTAIRSRKAAMQRCWKDKTLVIADPPTPLSVELSVSRDGKVTKVHVSAGNAYVETCLERVLAAIQLPSGPDAYVIRYPLNE